MVQNSSDYRITPLKVSTLDRRELRSKSSAVYWIDGGLKYNLLAGPRRRMAGNRLTDPLKESGFRLCIAESRAFS